MKKIVTVALLALAVGGPLALGSRVAAQPRPEVDEARVNAHVDARLRQVLHGLVLSLQTQASVER